MILAYEMTWTGAAHAPGNSATLQTIARALPDQQIRVFADPSHLSELNADPALAVHSKISFHAITPSPHFHSRTHIVSPRRFQDEFAIIRSTLRKAPACEPCLLVLLSATPTAIFAASLVARTARRKVMVQVGLHGNLNELMGWRSRNPLIRAFDLPSALAARHGGRVRFLVLEEAIRQEMARIAPHAAAITDVLPLPVNLAEVAISREQPLEYPVRIGLVGQATEAKGITPFLALARYFNDHYPGLAEFHLVGQPRRDDDLTRFAPLAHPVRHEALPRSDFIRRLARLHFICLPMQPGYYSLSASGALIDAITWLRPIIATRVPIIADLADRFGDIGYVCENDAAMREAVRSLLDPLDPQRYRRQAEALRRARDERLPERLAHRYRTIVEEKFERVRRPPIEESCPCSPFRRRSEREGCPPRGEISPPMSKPDEANPPQTA
jgi:glycosyltransferase involved in cell wall biosynthesis